MSGAYPWPYSWQLSFYATYTSAVISGSGWAIIGTLTSVVLPLAPKTFNDQNPSDISVFKVTGQKPILIGVDVAERTLRLDGSIWIHGVSNATLEATYLNPLRSIANQVVQIMDPDNQYSGTWIMKQPDFKRDAEGSDVRYTYTITFLKGSDQISYTGTPMSASSVPQLRAINISNHEGSNAHMTSAMMDGVTPISQTIDGTPFILIIYNDAWSSPYIPYVYFNRTTDGAQLFRFSLYPALNIGDSLQIIVTQYEDGTWNLSD